MLRVYPYFLICLIFFPVTSPWMLNPPLQQFTGRTLLLPMGRLPSTSVAESLVKGLRLAAQQGDNLFDGRGWENEPCFPMKKEWDFIYLYFNKNWENDKQ